MSSSHDPEKDFISTSPSQTYPSDPEKHLSQPPHLDPDSINPSPASSTHLDDNYELYKNAKDIDADEAEVKRVLRKIDYRIIPILFVTYMLQYLDKNSINFSSVYGLQKGTHLVGQDYSWLGRFLFLLSHEEGVWRGEWKEAVREDGGRKMSELLSFFERSFKYLSD
jgi:hypothetical protein